MSKPRAFQELGTKVHDMEMMIVNRHEKASPTCEARKEKGDLRKTLSPQRARLKNPWSITTSEPIQILGKQRAEDK